MENQPNNEKKDEISLDKKKDEISVDEKKDEISLDKKKDEISVDKKKDVNSDSDSDDDYDSGWCSYHDDFDENYLYCDEDYEYYRLDE